MSTESPYGFGANPPYSLYCNNEGKWGLIDGSSNKLPAVFDRIDENKFARVPWEVTDFDEKEGFTLLAWYDPGEVWFNFIFDDPSYPDEYTKYLWQQTDKEIEDFSDILYKLIPETNHWLIDCILKRDEIISLDDKEFQETINSIKLLHPEFGNPAVTNAMLEPIMGNPEIAEEIKRALWTAKVYLDSMLIL